MVTALYNTTEAVIVSDLSRNVLFANKSAENLLGIPLNAMLGKPIREIIRLYDTLNEITDMFYCPINTDQAEAKLFVKSGLKPVSSTNKESYINLTELVILLIS